MEMKLQRDEWAQVLGLLDTALDLPEPARPAWLEALALDPPHLKTALRQLLDDRRALETADFLAAGAVADAAPAPPGALLGPWRLLRELGTGGMAVVWLAERADGAHRRPVALKLPQRLLGSRVVGERFQRERAILSTLQHPHIAQVLDAGDADGQPWLALEFVDGLPITAHVAAQRLGVRATLQRFLPVLQAVQHAHAQLVIHRDIKPANVLVTAAGDVKLLDFGVAKLLTPEAGGAAETALTRLGGRAMTPQYASPEQVAGRPLGVATDVYSLGVLLYELLTGTLPYRLQRDSAAALEEAILAAQVQRPSQAVAEPRTARALRGDVDTIVMKALAADPARRYASVAALEDDIRRHLDALPIAARPATLAYRAGRLLRRHGLALGAAAAVAVALLAGTGVALWQADRARTEARRAEAVQGFLVRLLQTTDPQQGQSRELTATELLDLNAARIDTEFASQPDVQARLLHTVANLYVERGEPAKGRPLLERALALYAAQGAPADEARLQALFDLSELHFEADEVAPARAAIARATALAGRLHGEPNRWSGPLLTGLAWADWREGKLASAVRFADRAQAVMDMRTVQHQKTNGALATVYIGAGQLERARALLEVASSAGPQAAGLGTMDRLMDIYNLARVRYILGDYAHAEADLRALLPQVDRVAGASHGRTLMARSLLAQTLAERGDIAGGVAQARANLAATPRGEDNADPLAVQQAALGRMLRLAGQADEALPLVREALADTERRYPKPTAQREAMRRVLAEVLLTAGRRDEGIAALDTTLANLRSAADGRPQLNTPDVGQMLAVALRDTPRRAEALPLATEACAAMAVQRPPTSLPVLRCEAMKAWLGALAAAPAERAPALQRFVAARDRLFGAGLHERHPLRAELLAAEAEVLALDPARQADAQALAARADALYRGLLGVPLPQPMGVLH